MHDARDPAIQSQKEYPRLLHRPGTEEAQCNSPEKITSDEDVLPGDAVARQVVASLRQDVAKLASEVREQFFRQQSLLRALLEQHAMPIVAEKSNDLEHVGGCLAMPGETDEHRQQPDGEFAVQNSNSLSSRPSDGVKATSSGVTASSSVRSASSLRYEVTLARENRRLSQTIDDARMRALQEDLHGWKRQRRRLASFFESQKYIMMMGLLVLSNSVLVGLQVDAASLQGSTQLLDAYFAADVAYTCIFLADTLLKLVAFGIMQYFYYDADRVWNLLDSLVVGVSLIEPTLKWLALSTDPTLSNATILRVLRLARLARAVRVIRIFKFVQPLRTLLLSISSTMKSVFWAFVFITAVNYVVSIVLAQATADLCRDSLDSSSVPDGACESYTSMQYWSSMATSMLSLFQVSTQGLNWSFVYHGVAELGIASQLLFLQYIFCMYFVFLNTITAVFCSTAIEAANRDSDIAIMQHAAQKEAHRIALKKLFDEQDGGGSCFICLDALEKVLETPTAKAIFEAMELDTLDARAIFDLFDVERQGYLHVEDLVSGCLQLKGTAKAMQLASLSQRYRSQNRKLDALNKILQEVRAALTSRVSNSSVN